MKRKLPNSLVLFLMLFSFTGHTAALTWQLVDVTFDDGGVATGSFDYDADTNIYSAINIETSGGTNQDFANTPSYGVAGFREPFSIDQFFFFTFPTLLADVTGSFVLGLAFDLPLTNAGGTVLVSTAPLIHISVEAICNDPTCFSGDPFRSIIGGSVSAVPAPAAVWLFGSALVGLGVVRKKRRA